MPVLYFRPDAFGLPAAALALALAAPRMRQTLSRAQVC
jgi:phosphotransferase system  glucose/maltose/N-acetylglucosamine-specific IIC component